MLFLALHLDCDRYLVDAREVIEVLPFVTIRPTRGTPPEVAGIFDYRGEFLPAIDLTRLLKGRPSRQAGQIDGGQEFTPVIEDTGHLRRSTASRPDRDKGQHFDHLARIDEIAIAIQVKGQEQHDPAAVSGGRLQLEAGDAVTQPARHFGQFADGCARLTQGLDRLSRRLGELGERLTDLLGAGGLRLHTLVHRLDARSERLHLLDDLRELRAHLLYVVHAATHF